MLIIEGPDLVGKTTLCKEVVTELNRLGWPHSYRHFGRMPSCWEEDPVRLYRLSMSPYTVQDRFHMSEVVYAIVEGPSRKPHLGPSSFEMVDRELRNHWEGYSVVVTADPQLLRDRYEELVGNGREEDYDIDGVLRANELYREICSTGQVNSVGVRCHVDCHIHLAGGDDEWPSVQRHLRLHAYTNRMDRSFSYPRARRA